MKQRGPRHEEKRSQEEKSRRENVGQETLTPFWKTEGEDWLLIETIKVGCHLLATQESVNGTQDPENRGSGTAGTGGGWGEEKLKHKDWVRVGGGRGRAALHGARQLPLPLPPPLKEKGGYSLHKLKSKGYSFRQAKHPKNGIQRESVNGTESAKLPWLSPRTPGFRHKALKQAGLTP